MTKTEGCGASNKKKAASLEHDIFAINLSIVNSNGVGEESRQFVYLWLQLFIISSYLTLASISQAFSNIMLKLIQIFFL